MAVAGFDEDEFTLTDIVEYVNRVAVQLEDRGLTRKQVRKIIDGYGHFVRDEWIEGTSSKDLAQEFLTMYRSRVPMHPSPKPLYQMSRYVACIIMDLLAFGFEPEDALVIVDDFDDCVVAWFPLVPARVAARRLGVMHNRLEAGIGVQEAREG